MDIYAHCAIAFLIRLGLLIYGYFQDLYFNVKYTDIDYQVFTDAASYVWKGESPFKCDTYRYSPFLAVLLTPNIFLHNGWGKFLFSSLDIVTCLLIFYILKNYHWNLNICKISAFLWLYNPLPMVISTRGNSESIMTSLIMLSIFCFQHNWIFLFGLIYGFAVHMKIYPCIYSVTFYIILSCVHEKNAWEKLQGIIYPNKKQIVLVFSTIIGFLLPTLVSVHFYGKDYIDEALLYHFIRKDVQHNFSPYFYSLYLSETVNQNILMIISYSAFFIQAFLILLVSWVFYLPKTLPACLFIETFIFVTFNKVCTSQYFLWYLCLFPLSYPSIHVRTKNLVGAFAVWIAGQGLWLLPAYYLEFEGKNMFLCLCISSLIFFIINVYLISRFIKLVSNALDVTTLKNIKEN